MANKKITQLGTVTPLGTYRLPMAVVQDVSNGECTLTALATEILSGRISVSSCTVTIGAFNATGISITSAASGSGVTLTATGGTNEAVIINGKGTGGIAFRGFSATASTVTLGDKVFIINGGTGLYVDRINSYTGGGVYVLGSNFGIGLSSPTYALHIAPTSGVTAGQTMFVQDATASTGVTTVKIAAGAGQSSTDLQQWLAVNGSTILANMNGTGVMIAVALRTNSYLQFSSFGYIQGASDGVWTLNNNAGNDFNRLQFGGTTSSFPALKRSTTVLQARLADDSAYASFEAKSLGIGAAAGSYSLTIAPTTGATAGSTVLIQDATTSTGVTTVKIRAGAGQGSPNFGALLQMEDNSGALLGGVTWAGGFFAINGAHNGVLIQFDTAVGGTGGLSLNSVGAIGWGSTVNAYDTADVALRRSAAGVINVDSGTAGTLRDLKVRDITVASATFHITTTTLTNGAAAQVATMTNGPSAGNPTKWVPVNDNGTTRYCPLW